MPAWTFGKILREAPTRIGHRSDVPLSDASFWGLEALEQLASEHRDSLLEKTASYSCNSGTSLLSVPDDMFEPISLSITSTHDAISAFTIRPMGLLDMDAQGYLPPGAPQGWAIWNKYIQLCPSCNSSANTTATNSGRSIQLRYYAFPEEPSIDSVPSLDTGWHRAAMHLTASLIASSIGLVEEAAVEQANYYAYAASRKDALARRQSTAQRHRVSLTLRKSRKRSS